MIPYSRPKLSNLYRSYPNCLNHTLPGGTYLYNYPIYTVWHRAILYDLEKWFQKVFIICFISQWMKRSKYGLFIFLPKKTLIWRRHCLIGQKLCCSMMSKWSIDWFLESSSGMKFFQPNIHLTNQKPRAFVSVQQTNQIALFPIICCFFFCTVHLIVHIQCSVNLSYCISFTEPILTPMLNFSICSNIKTRQEFKKETPLQSF